MSKITSPQIVKRLAKLAATADTTSINDTSFRSPEEVKLFLKETIKNIDALFKELKDLRAKAAQQKVTSRLIKVVSASAPIVIDVDNTTLVKKDTGPGRKLDFVAPNASILAKQYDVIDKLHDKISQLETMTHILNHEFKGVTGSGGLQREVKTLHKALSERVTKSMHQLSLLASKHEPKLFQTITQHLSGTVKSTLKNMFTKATERAYATPYGEDGNQVLFTHYLEMDNVTDDEGYVHDKFYVVWSCLVSATGHAKFYVTSLVKFLPPGRFSLGVEFKDVSDGELQTYVELEHENFSTFVDRQPVPTTVQKLKTVISVPKGSIQKAVIEDDVISFQLKSSIKSKDAAHAAANAILKELNSFFQTITKTKVKYRVYKEGSSWTADFVLTAPNRDELKKARIDATRAERLKDDLDLSADQLHEILKIIGR